MGCTSSTTMLKDDRSNIQPVHMKEKENSRFEENVGAHKKQMDEVKVHGTGAKPDASGKRPNAGNNEINLTNILSGNKNLGNQPSPTKMSKSTTQDRIINQVKSEVYDEIMRDALDEVDEEVSDFKL